MWSVVENSTLMGREMHQRQVLQRKIPESCSQRVSETENITPNPAMTLTAEQTEDTEDTEDAERESFGFSTTFSFHQPAGVGEMMRLYLPSPSSPESFAFSASFAVASIAISRMSASVCLSVSELAFAPAALRSVRKRTGVGERKHTGPALPHPRASSAVQLALGRTVAGPLFKVVATSQRSLSGQGPAS